MLLYIKFEVRSIKFGMFSINNARVIGFAPFKEISFNE